MTVRYRCTLLLVALTALPAVAAPTPEQIKEVAADLVCLCGSCNRESLATCLCGAFAVPERESIGRMLSAGRTREQIVDGYVERFGPMVLANPPEGYDVVWIVPFVVLIGGVFGVRQVLVYWRRERSGRSAASGETTPTVGSEPSPHEERLRRELDAFES